MRKIVTQTNCFNSDAFMWIEKFINTVTYPVCINIILSIDKFLTMMFFKTWQPYVKLWIILRIFLCKKSYNYSSCFASHFQYATTFSSPIAKMNRLRIIHVHVDQIYCVKIYLHIVHININVQALMGIYKRRCLWPQPLNMKFYHTETGYW